jgi:hypothetical protein
MTTANTVGAASRNPNEWDSIMGLKLSGNVRRLQVRIVKATKEGIECHAEGALPKLLNNENAPLRCVAARSSSNALCGLSLGDQPPGMSSGSLTVETVCSPNCCCFPRLRCWFARETGRSTVLSSQF